MMKPFKILSIVVSVLIVLYVGNFAISYFSNKAEDEIYVLPNNFEGAVIVLFNEESGEAKKYDDEGNRVYNVPKSGVLKTKFIFQDGFRDIQYKKDNGEKIRYLFPSDKVWKDTINEGKKELDSTYAYGASYANDYWFIIGKPKDSEYWTKKMTEKWKPYSNTKTLQEGESTGNVRHNKLFDE